VQVAGGGIHEQARLCIRDVAEDCGLRIIALGNGAIGVGPAPFDS
jgi:hypothetical protein